MAPVQDSGWEDRSAAKPRGNQLDWEAHSAIYQREN